MNSYRRPAHAPKTAYPSRDFEGVWVDYWPNGQVSYRGTFRKEQLKVGQHLAFWEHGVLRELSYWVEGQVTGTSVNFYENGTKESERDYGATNSKDGSFTERLYGLDGRLASIFVWKNDVIISEWSRPDLIEFGKEIGLDQRIEAAIKKLYPDS